jgi:hypothetical protein
VGRVKVPDALLEIFITTLENEQHREGVIIFVVRGHTVACPVALPCAATQEVEVASMLPPVQPCSGALMVVGGYGRCL